LHNDGSEGLDLLNRTGDDTANSQIDRSLQFRLAQRVGEHCHPRQVHARGDRRGEVLAGAHINCYAVISRPLRDRVSPQSRRRQRDLGHREELAKCFAPPQIL
jgi:hypothetical protein